jgi:hypothetical protein
MNDEERKLWIVSEAAAQSKAAAEDLDGLGLQHAIRASTVLEVGFHTEILSRGESDRMMEALNNGEKDEFAFLQLRD